MIEIKLPESIKVGGFDFKIDLSESRSKELTCANLAGQERTEPYDISIKIDMSPQQFSNTFIHEAIHAVDSIYRPDLEEKQVLVLTNGLHQIFEQLGIRFVK